MKLPARAITEIPMEMLHDHVTAAILEAEQWNPVSSGTFIRCHVKTCIYTFLIFDNILKTRHVNYILITIKLLVCTL